MESMSLWSFIPHEADIHAYTCIVCMYVHYVDNTYTVVAVTGTVYNNCTKYSELSLICHLFTYVFAKPI